MSTETTTARIARLCGHLDQVRAMEWKTAQAEHLQIMYVNDVTEALAGWEAAENALTATQEALEAAQGRVDELEAQERNIKKAIWIIEAPLEGIVE